MNHRGKLSGVVTDIGGAAIPQAQVRICDLGGGAEHEATAGPNGLFAFPDLLGSDYRVNVNAPGFDAFSQRVTVTTVGAHVHAIMQQRKDVETVRVIGYSCGVTAPQGRDGIVPGDVVVITGTASGLDPAQSVEYSWASDSGPVQGTSNVATIDTAGLAPGRYTVKGHVQQGPAQADCSTTFTVREGRFTK